MADNLFKPAEIVGFKSHPYNEEGGAVGVIFCEYGEALYEVDVFTEDGCAGRVLLEDQLIKLTKNDQEIFIQRLPENRRKELLDIVRRIDAMI